jgi:hypothetical protein
MPWNSEWNPNRCHHGVIVLVVMAGADLEAGAGDESNARMEGKAAEDEPGRDEGLLLAIVGVALPEG